MARSDLQRYHWLSVLLHWSVALLIIGLLVLGFFLEDLPKGPFRKELFNLHKSFGLIVFALIVFRIFWRLKSPVPDHVPGTAYQVGLAKLAHVLIYILMVFVPLAALTAGSFNRGFDFFALHLDPVFPVNKDFSHQLMNVHGWVAYALAALVLLHVSAAIWHHFIKKDGLLRRMWIS